MRPLPALATLLVLSACASGPRSAGEPPAPTVAGALPLSALGLPRDLPPWPSLYPEPRRASYEDVLLPLEGAEVLLPGHAGFDARLREVGLDLGWEEVRQEGFVLSVGVSRGRVVVARGARDPAGERWAEAALDQLTVVHDGRRLARACRVVDAPVFPLRGSKRPEAWELRYRANFAWDVRPGVEPEGRVELAAVAPGSPLDATARGVERTLERFRTFQERGVALFAVRLDDVGFGLTPESALWFGSYPRALRSYLAAVLWGLRERDPGARLWLLPQTYWWDDPRLPELASALRGQGGLEPEIGLVVTGPQVVSEEIDAAGVAAARLVFGLRETPAMIYDNRGREGDWGPLAGRDPALAAEAIAVFGERGTPVNRLTRLDWLWNPDGYDPERSYRRAVLELAGPTAYRALLDACDGLRRGVPQHEAAALVERFAAAPDGGYVPPLPRDELLARLRRDVERLAAEAP